MPSQPIRPIPIMLKAAAHKGEDLKALQQFSDFLEKALVIDPKKRMTADEALGHPFLNILLERASAKQAASK
jgi:serine/threonine protein kinase